MLGAMVRHCRDDNNNPNRQTAKGRNLMSEEAEVVEESNDFPMESALDEISNDLFPKSATDEDEGSDDIDEPEDRVEAKDKAPAESNEKVAEAKPDETEQAIKDELNKSELPASWKKDMEDKWSSTDPEIQKYILQREDQMREGLEKDRGDANLGRTMRDVMTPYEAMFRDRGIEAPQAVKSLLHAHHTLSNGSPEQKQAYLQQLAQSYGVSAQGEAQGDPQITSLTQRLQSIEQNLNASQERALQANKERIEAEVSTFAESHPHFEELSGDIAIFINGGLSLEDAYEKALNANSAIKDAEIERRVAEKIAEQQEQAKKETAEAKKAKSVNVQGRNTNRAPTAPLGSMEDTMRETYRALNSK